MQASGRGGRLSGGGGGGGRRAWRRRHAGVLVAACVLLGREALLRCEEALFIAGGGRLGLLPSSLRRAPTAAAAEVAAEAASEAAVADAKAAEGEGAAGGDKRMRSQVGLQTLSGPIGGEFGGGLVWINRPGQRSFEVRWAANDTVADLKKVIRQQSELPYDNQELRCNGIPVQPDDLDLDEWVREAGGISAGFSGQAPDIWVFDATDEDERDAAYPPIVVDEELTPGQKTFKNAVFSVTGLMVLFTFTQAIGINPFVDRTGKIYDTTGMQWQIPDDMMPGLM